MKERTCQCGQKETEPVPALGHQWTDATCETAKTCTVCGKGEGEPLGHWYSDGACIRCGKEDPNIDTPATGGNQVGDLCISQELPRYGADGTVSVEDTRGKVTILNFWGTWCYYCVEEMNNVFPLILQEYRDDVAIIAVHSDFGSWNAESFIQQNYPDSPILFCQDLPDEGYAHVMGGGRSYPYTLILDRDGIIRVIIPGATNYESFKYILDDLV